MGQVDLRKFNETFGELLSRASDVRKPLTEIGIIMTSEMKENIRVQGRPEAWQQSRRAKREGGQTLRDTGTLMTGLIAEVSDKEVAAGPTQVGKERITDPRVFALLAFGGEVQRSARGGRLKSKKGKNSRPKTLGSSVAKYPKRDYTYVSPEANQTFGEILHEHLIG